MNEITKLTKENERLRRIATNLTIELDERIKKINKLERELLDSSRQVRSLEVNTATIECLEIIEDENDYSPYNTGQFKIRGRQ